jgi:hypothetical protein
MVEVSLCTRKKRGIETRSKSPWAIFLFIVLGYRVKQQAARSVYGNVWYKHHTIRIYLFLFSFKFVASSYSILYENSTCKLITYYIMYYRLAVNLCVTLIYKCTIVTALALICIKLSYEN